LLVTQDKYDLISMELSSIWFAGAGALYNREFYALAKSRLAPGGIFQQWVQLHHIYPVDLASIFASIRAVFPHVALYMAGNQGVLVAAESPLTGDRKKLDGWCRNAQIARACKTFPANNLTHLLDKRILNSAQIDTFVAAQAKAHDLLPEHLISTDDAPYLEYSTPRGNMLSHQSGEWTVANLRKFSK
jgi:spermidine synthase